jgi:tellurite resistance-related uncharacterized protein
MKALPDNVQVYKKTANFTEITVPPAILNRHNTKAGVWGRLVIVSGQVEFVDLESGALISATPQRSVNIVPEAWHCLRFNGPCEFYVEFLK